MPNKTKNYQQLGEELAEIIVWFESADLDLDKAVEKYDQAEQIMNQMQEYLAQAENKIKKITAKLK